MKLLLFFSSIFGSFCYGYNQHRIMSGQPAPPEKYQNVVRLLSIIMLPHPVIKGIPVTAVSTCTGSIISPRHILTAAHCVTNPMDRSSVTELYGIFIEYRPIKYDTEQQPSTMNLQEVALATAFHFHEGWHWQSFQHDIAIIEFPVGTKLGEPIKLAKNYEEGLNDVGINVGYGDMDLTANVSKLSTTLMEAELRIFPKKDCMINNISHPNICVGDATHRPGQGDSGGPLFFNATANGKQYQIGITHDGVTKNGEPSEQSPDFTAFMRISAYCDWIEEKTNNEAKCEDMPKNAPNAEAQHADNGSMSKNIFVILSTLFFVFVLNIISIL